MVGCTGLTVTTLLSSGSPNSGPGVVDHIQGITLARNALFLPQIRISPFFATGTPLGHPPFFSSAAGSQPPLPQVGHLRVSRLRPFQ
eukprot:2230800-Rhodomonas_salina.1